MNDDLVEYFSSDDNMFKLFHGDTFNLLSKLKFKFNMIFSDPPYFLSNGGKTIKNSKISSVNKGTWDESQGIDFIDNFNYRWLSIIKNIMTDNATIWVSGTKRNIFSVGNALNKLGFKILNIITWEKVNPPHNFSKSFFNFSTELLIWAKKDNGFKHRFNYDVMKKINRNMQMKDIMKII